MSAMHASNQCPVLRLYNGEGWTTVQPFPGMTMQEALARVITRGDWKAAIVQWHDRYVSIEGTNVAGTDVKYALGIGIVEVRVQ